MNTNWLQNNRKIIGVMTGTSLDAIDISIADFYIKDGFHKFSLLYYDEIPIKFGLRKKIIEISEKPVKISEISNLNYAVSYFYANSINEFIKKHNINKNEIDAVGIHGQTVWHQPEGEMFGDQNISSTLQLGNGSVLSKLLKLTVVNDFRSADIALGGHGAPLVPIFDVNFLFSGKPLIALNIGGIANVSIITGSKDKPNVIAFDTGPGNMLIDLMMNDLFGKAYDEDGNIAAKGIIIPELYNKLMNIEYLNKKPPKSTGRELFNYNLISKFIRKEFDKYDIINTLTNFTASSIAMNIINQKIYNGNIYISGGGSKNKYLMNLLKQKLQNFIISETDKLGVPSDAKESLCFAYLAYRTLGGLWGNIPSVTGAKEKTVLGSVSY